IWLGAAASGFCEAIYITGLAGAYARGNLSVNYALVRAIPVILIPVAAWLLGRGPLLTGQGLVGMGLVAGGCLLLPLTRWQGLHPRAWWQPATRFAILGAIGTTGYTLFDDHSLRTLREA